MTAQEYIENSNMEFYNMTIHETGLVEISYDDLTDLMESYAKCSLHNVVGQSEQLFCRDCKYDKAETYHDKMWCRDCRQKDRFKVK